MLATPRIRRTNAYPRQLLLNTAVTAENVGLYAALRLDPAGGPPAPGEVSEVVAAAGVGVAGAVITERDMLSSSPQRVRVEGLARSIAATWDQWFAPRVAASAWNVGIAPLQLDIIEQLVVLSRAAADNPFQRRRFIQALVHEHEGFALPPWLVEIASDLAANIRQQP